MAKTRTTAYRDMLKRDETPSPIARDPEKPRFNIPGFPSGRPSGSNPMGRGKLAKDASSRLARDPEDMNDRKNALRRRLKKSKTKFPDMGKGKAKGPKGDHTGNKVGVPGYPGRG